MVNGVANTLPQASDRILKFTGCFDFVLDAKGRGSTPVRIREVLDMYGVNSITLRLMPFDKLSCIRAYPTSYYNETILGKLTEYEEGETSDDTFAIMLLTANAHQIKLDGQGRINFPADLLKDASIQKELRFVGMGNFFDIWNPESFKAFQTAQIAKRAELKGASEAGT